MAWICLMIGATFIKFGLAPATIVISISDRSRLNITAPQWAVTRSYQKDKIAILAFSSPPKLSIQIHQQRSAFRSKMLFVILAIEDPSHILHSILILVSRPSYRPLDERYSIPLSSTRPGFFLWAKDVQHPEKKSHRHRAVFTDSRPRLLKARAKVGKPRLNDKFRIIEGAYSRIQTTLNSIERQIDMPRSG